MKVKTFKMKKLLSAILAFAMIATMVLPTSVFATTLVSSDVVASVNKGTGTELVNTITIGFDSEITFDNTDFATNVTLSDSHTFGTDATAELSSDSKAIVITLGNDADVVIGDRITFANDVLASAAVPTDVYNGDTSVITGSLTPATVDFDAPAGVTVTVEGATPPAEYGVGTYSYKAEGTGFTTVEDNFEIVAADLGSATPKVITVPAKEIGNVGFTAVAVSSDVAKNYGKADSVVVVFSEAIDATAAEILAQFNDTAFADAEWVGSTKTVLKLTLAENHTLSNNAAIKYTMNSDIETVLGKVVNTYNTNIEGNLEGSVSELVAAEMVATIVNVDATPGVATGDKIVLVFNAPVEGKLASIDVTTSESETLTATAIDSTRTIYEISDFAGKTVNDDIELTFGGITNVALNGSFGKADMPVVLKALATDEDGTAKVAGDKIYVMFNRPTNAVSISPDDLYAACAKLGTDAQADWASNAELVITVGTDASIKVDDALTLAGLGIKDEYNYNANEVDFSTLTVGGSFGTAIKPRVVKAVAVSKTGHSTAAEGDQIVIMFNTLVTHKNITVKAKDGSFGTDFDNENKDTNGNNSFINWKDDGVTTLTITLGSEPDVELNKTAVNLVGEIKDAHSETLECENIDFIKVKDGSFGIKILPELVSATIVKVSERPTASENDKVVLVFSAPTNGANILSYLGGSTLFGASAGQSWNNIKTVYTIELSSGAEITDGSDVVLPSNTGLKDQYEIAEVPAASKKLAGSFGKATAPELLTANIIKTTTTPEAQEDDEIVLVFSSRTNGADIVSKVLVNSVLGSLGANAQGTWSLDNTVYTIKLGSGNKNIDDADIISLDASCGLKDFYNVIDCNSVKTATLEGSFGEEVPEVPQIVSAVATSEDGEDFIKISFNMETNLESIIDDTLKASLKAVNPKLGDIAVVTKDTQTLKIKLGADATIEHGNTIELAPLGIESKTTGTALRTTTVECSGYMAPVVSNVVAENGGIIKITFTTRTNKANINLEPSAALYGEGATATWSDDTKTLVITLGTDYGITERGYISLDNLGIKDGYSGSYVVSGQYKIQSGSFTTDALEAKSAIAKSSTTTVTTAAAGDKITITFSYATDKPADLANIISEVKSGETILANAFGTGATCEWITSQKLVITLGDAPEIKRDDVIFFNKANIKKLSGDALTTDSIVLKGSFDGRDYFLSGSYVAQTATAKDHSFKVVVDNTSNAVAAKPTIVCVAYNGTTPVAISRVSAGIDETAEFVFTFSGSYTITNAKVYAFKGLFDDVMGTPEVLAETKTINK